MKNINQYIIVTLILFLFNSCEKKLNIDPTTYSTENIILSNGENVKNLLIGTYEISGRSGSLGGYTQVVSDLLGYDKQVSWNGTFAELRQVYSKDMLADNVITSLIWNNTFKVVSHCNLIIDHLDLISDPVERASVEGQAYFLRAISNFDLLRLFGNDKLGIPLRTSSIKDYASDLSIERSSTTDCYKKVIDDLNKSIMLLPDANGFLADKYAALSTLSRVHLYLENYPLALEAANEVIEKSGRTLAGNYASAFNKDNNGNEDIYSTQVTSQSGVNFLNTFYASQEFGGRGGDISINQDYLNIFDDTLDQRAHFFYTNEMGNQLSSKFTNQYGNVPIIRLAELILIRAECNQRLNSSTGRTPLEDVNSIRNRSGASSLQTLTLDQILLERQRELAFEGFAIYEVKRTKSSVAGLNYNDPKLVLPIPQSEIDANKLMKQNTGY